MPTFHLHIKGLVQGLGFRPHVFLLARRMGLRGWVNNASDGVHLVFNASASKAQALLDSLLQAPPPLALITGYAMEEIRHQEFEHFQIRHSDDAQQASLLITPDFGLCAACATELNTPGNRRFGYPFITCIHCGPRYSILERLPYDRPNTAMRSFDMCPDCMLEYQDPGDRRYYAQTNSCPACGIRLFWQGQADEAGISRARSAIEQGQIVAVKGIGGFLLLADAGNPEAIQRLRQRKHRPGKPFAVMYPDLSMLLADTHLDEPGAAILSAAAAPVLITDLRQDSRLKLTHPLIAPGMESIGVLLPYTPLFTLLMQLLNKPVIATSANVSNSPIRFQDNQAIPEADAVLSHDRPIIIPQDDSVIRMSPLLQLPTIIRRARGLAPAFRVSGLNLPKDAVLAMGPMMKSTFCIAQHEEVYISQYLGDLGDFDTELHYRHCLAYFLNLISCQPKRILIDRHPGYPSSRMGQQLAGQWSVPLKAYQHHRAHFAAVLAEHALLESREPILGVIWDGTGLGDDGQLWGGEMFSYAAGEMHRLTHVAYFPVIAGDNMAREPRLAALSLMHGDAASRSTMQAWFTPSEWQVYHAQLAHGLPHQTSSMGRVFDAMAALLGMPRRTSYEGEAAMLLEQAAIPVFRKAGLSGIEPLDIPLKSGMPLDAADLWRQANEALQAGADPGLLAARFHVSLVAWIEAVAQQSGLEQLAFSGGVFQNTLLTDVIRHRLGGRYRLYFHQQLSPNDENIAFGQIVLDQLNGSDRA